MALTKYKLGELIECSTVNNKDLKYGTDLIAGVNNEGVFTIPKGNPIDVDLKPYKLVHNGAFVYNPTRLNLGSIAYRTEGFCIVSHLYIVFYLNAKGKEVVNPYYLYIYFHREEFCREVTFRNFGSQRPEFSFNDMADISITLPDPSIQQKYVDVYLGLQKNLTTYQSKIEELKTVCDGYIEDLRRNIKSERIGTYIKRYSEKNSSNEIEDVVGLSTKKRFRVAQSRVNRNELSGYKIVHPLDIAYVPTTDTWKVLAFAVNHFEKDVVVSPIYEVFTTIGRLKSDYLAIWFKRAEFDRYARYNSWGSARENFSFEEMEDVMIPIPDENIQQSIIDLYLVYEERKAIAEKLKEQLKNICPVLIRGSLNEK